MQLIEVMVESYKMANYHVAIAMLACIEGVAISRLKKSWAVVEEDGKHLLAALDYLRVQFSSQLNWKIYREIVQQQLPPCLPFLGVFLQDITFIDDGNPSYIGEELLNWEKFQRFSNCLSDMQKFLYVKFDFKPVPEIQDCIKCIKVFDDKEVYQISLAVEPRE